MTRSAFPALRWSGRGRRPATVAAALALTAISGLALAHSGATGIVKQRMEAMKDIAAQMKQIGAMIKGERDYDSAAASLAAGAIVQHAGNMLSLFPEGANESPSEALTVIWTDWDGFSESAEELEANAVVLSEVAGNATSAAEIRAAFAAVGKTCSSCHEDYRKPK
ncbi:cytochrome c [Nitratireductor sp. XY-223]|uniref:c-type cytochrome n=1 Tax=Nitratireductor sp. XY-223 TaxID=2561926 RepID=UPI00145BB72D|nr:cytochrome c [Nitratireductor sp. XY-223]